MTSCVIPQTWDRCQARWLLVKVFSLLVFHSHNNNDDTLYFTILNNDDTHFLLCLDCCFHFLPLQNKGSCINSNSINCMWNMSQMHEQRDITERAWEEKKKRLNGFNGPQQKRFEFIPVVLFVISEAGKRHCSCLGFRVPVCELRVQVFCNVPLFV